MHESYREALLKVKTQLATGSDQVANEASVKLAAWFLNLMDEGYKLAVVKGTEIKALEVRVDEHTFIVN